MVIRGVPQRPVGAAGEVADGRPPAGRVPRLQGPAVLQSPRLHILLFRTKFSFYLALFVYCDVTL